MKEIQEEIAIKSFITWVGEWKGIHYEVNWEKNTYLWLQIDRAFVLCFWNHRIDWLKGWSLFLSVLLKNKSSPLLMKLKCAYSPLQKWLAKREGRIIMLWPYQWYRGTDTAQSIHFCFKKPWLINPFYHHIFPNVQVTSNKMVCAYFVRVYREKLH